MTTHMENVAALMRDDTTTLSARYQPDGMLYTFKVPLDLSRTLTKGDLVLCRSQQKIKVVEVVEVHDVPQLDPDADFIYQWAFQKVDLHTLNDLRDEDDAVAIELRQHRQHQVRDNALAALGVTDTTTVIARAQARLEAGRHG